MAFDCCWTSTAPVPSASSSCSRSPPARPRSLLSATVSGVQCQFQTSSGLLQRFSI
ncbi:unnamed protein product [Symbiodinium microadriaticum]|nr:unnamed protein product [Symbiodinium microadriaticum]